MENEYVAELDYKCEKNDFIFFLTKTKGFIRLGLEIQPDTLMEEDAITDWCSVLGEKWADKNACILGLDIDSDSYVIFAAETWQAEQLATLAEQIHHRIALAQKM